MFLSCQWDIAVDPHSVSAQTKEDTIVSFTLWFQALWLWQGFKPLVDFVINSFHVSSSQIMEEIFFQEKNLEKVIIGLTILFPYYSKHKLVNNK